MKRPSSLVELAYKKNKYLPQLASFVDLDRNARYNMMHADYRRGLYLRARDTLQKSFEKGFANTLGGTLYRRSLINQAHNIQKLNPLK